MIKQSLVFSETLPASTAKVVDLLQTKKPRFLDDFYLSGGTALSLQLGHRESEDLDFFIEQEFAPDQLQADLLKLGTLEQTELDRGTLNTFFNGVKLQFLEYPYRLIEPLEDWGAIKLSSVVDIACTKLQTIGMRGSKKDFVDLYFILEQMSLASLFELMSKKYTEVNYSQIHILKSLVFFEDAEQQPMPRMHKKVDWDLIKQRMNDEVKQIKF
jgi:predicted nucleotidyltransferase component of viral defense system